MLQGLLYVTTDRSEFQGVVLTPVPLLRIFSMCYALLSFTLLHRSRFCFSVLICIPTVDLGSFDDRQVRLTETAVWLV